MPRGPRQPSPQSNRTDQLAPAAPTAAPDQAYGQAGQQLAAQQALPIANGPTATAAQPPAPSGPPDLLAQTMGHNGPGDLSLERPTERPNEPVTHGLPVGPGAGPEALTGIGAATRDATVEQGTLQHLLGNLASSPGATSAIRDLAARAQSGAM